VNQAIERGEVQGNRKLVVTVTAGVARLAVLLTAKKPVILATQQIPEKLMNEFREIVLISPCLLMFL
jgi:hypothetical protein